MRRGGLGSEVEVKKVQGKSRPRAEWQRLVKELAEAGTSPKDFAAKHGVNVRTLVWWRAMFEREGAKRSAHGGSSPGPSLPRSVPPAASLDAPSSVQFVRVDRGSKSSAASKVATPAIRLSVGPVRISLESGFDRGTLAAVLQTLGVEGVR